MAECARRRVVDTRRLDGGSAGWRKYPQRIHRRHRRCSFRPHCLRANVMPFGGSVAGYRIVVAGPAFLLELISTSATTGFSTRKIASAYAGSALRVRRSSDNAEQDISFISNDLDTASLTSFVGANNGFIVKWYDQSGNGRDLMQSTAANQPQIVASGVVDTTIGAKPTIHFLVGSGTVLTTNVSIGTAGIWTSAYTSMCIAQITNFSTPAALYAAPLMQDSNGYTYTCSTQIAASGFMSGLYNDASPATVSGSTATKYVLMGKRSGSTYNVYANGGAGGSASQAATLNPSAGFFTVGQGFGTPTLDGYVNEVVTYATNLSSADLNTLGVNMAARAGVTWSTI